MFFESTEYKTMIVDTGRIHYLYIYTLKHNEYDTYNF